MTGVVVGLDQERTSVADFTSYLYIDQKTIIYKRPMIEPDIAGFLKPYTATVRISIHMLMTLSSVTSTRTAVAQTHNIYCNVTRTC